MVRRRAAEGAAGAAGARASLKPARVMGRAAARARFISPLREREIHRLFLSVSAGLRGAGDTERRREDSDGKLARDEKSQRERLRAPVRC